MPSADHYAGAIAASLEADLLRELTRQGIVVWLDRDGTYTPFVDALVERRRLGTFPHAVVGHRGSWLETLFALEPHLDGLDKPALLLHLPGHNEDSVRTTPALALYEAGTRFRRSLDTLIRETAAGQVAPDVLDAFLASNSSGAASASVPAADAAPAAPSTPATPAALTLESADRWLDAQRTGVRDRLATLLQDTGPQFVLDDLIALLTRKPRSLAAEYTTRAELEVLEAYLHRVTGMDRAFRDFYGEDQRARPLDNLATAFVAWLLCVEYVHDLARPPHLEVLQRLRKLSPPLIATARTLTAHLREHHADAYATLADEVEQRIAEELENIRPIDLGRIDTFRGEEKRVLRAAIDALREGDWDTALRKSEERSGASSFWLQRDQAKRWTWTLVAEAAELGALLRAHSSAPAASASPSTHSSPAVPGTLDDAVAHYARTLYVVDRAHRRFEQKRATLLEPRLEHFGDLQEVVGKLRARYRAWADALARDFSARCRAHGFLPDAALQQRTLYEQVVQPLASGSGRTAVFLVDALRYEMATELADEIRADSGAVVDLKARLAELPTATVVGMNALAPVAQNGRLRVAGEFEGFRTGEFTVRRPQDRSRAMGVRSLGKPALLLDLAEICSLDQAKLAQKVSQSRLIVVQSREIDDAGEANFGIRTFEATLRDLVAAYHHLLAARVEHFVITADHGFLLQDETTRVQPFGTKRDPSRRHVLDSHPRNEDGMVPVALSSLGYEGLEGYLLFREDTAVFATGTAGASFVHGGNSPQERVIPVLTVARKRQAPGSENTYDLEAEALADVLGHRRLRLRVSLVGQHKLSLGDRGTVDVALRVPERPEIGVTVKEVSGAGALKSGRLQVTPGEEWTEVFFALEGPRDERARVEVFHPDLVAKIAPRTLEAWFEVVGAKAPATAARPPSAPPPSPSAPVAAAPGWQSAFNDEAVRRVFEHIEKHGSITEPEATHLLGSPRAFRRFSNQFDAHADKLPFKIRIEAHAEGKRYVKERDR